MSFTPKLCLVTYIWYGDSCLRKLKQFANNITPPSSAQAKNEWSYTSIPPKTSL